MNEFKISISDEIYAVCPIFKFAAIQCKVKNNLHKDSLWQEINSFCSAYSAQNKIDDIKKRSAIFATREIYKKLGKDPNRYRPSAEALCRRIIRGLGLYQIDTVVDIINLVSLKTGYSIGGFDADKIVGNLVLGVGRPNEKFDAIGRGLLNIEGLPVYRDDIGGIGTPTSDEERTKITSETTHLLMIINAYSGEAGLEEAVNCAEDLLKKYAYAEEFSIIY
ncbi:MAG: phenylalanine--tRNA ligase beta subunit-related protein [Dysgonamonadaceae bacterium]|jgi:DNA/RNA-binding domain of Phe-tRNA-synthetase-like protein|nr:phenylalanine--tRNA ligase beta subunit-related protein [Dysgonamonadaceae bacterium]MDD3309633.1 phenylalanine--tRNA ligase beta subunit-related protein [Dysgonamonadaceae bacterium]MDD3900593.1 phenylalanine--tRNA ligase beta subunit-related protein [Dysgonamonadaceae bacterium]MDD4398045.1 phenylalanine--tRNA ligase beta subunit-related protein [Dysgonamonadaceae bacterium]MEA5081732.1 phenylalanine--tRNA ligase beta subunit-related protein [Dysgonamonadaceae bacterium]